MLTRSKPLFLLLIASMLFPVCFCKAQDYITGLIQHYPFTNETVDESHHSPNANVNLAGYMRDMHGYQNGAATLIGNTYYIEFPDSVKLWNAGWTYSVWFKLNGLPSEICDGDAFLLSYKTVATGDDVHLFVDDEDNVLKTYFKDGSFKVSSGIAVQRNRWYHAAVRYTATTTDLFVDGNFSFSSAGRFSPYPGYDPLMVSCLISSPIEKGRVFGSIDDIRMYKRNLSNADITALYNYEKNLVVPSLGRDTVYIHDTLVKIDTIFILDTLILGGDCIVYPNPVRGDVPLYISVTDRPAIITLYNSVGQFIRREDLTTQNYISVSGIAAGTYFIKVRTPLRTCAKKLVIIN